MEVKNKLEKQALLQYVYYVYEEKHSVLDKGCTAWFFVFLVRKK